MRIRLQLADRLRITLSELGQMSVAEYHMTLLLYVDRAEQREERP